MIDDSNNDLDVRYQLAMEERERIHQKPTGQAAVNNPIEQKQKEKELEYEK